MWMVCNGIMVPLRAQEGGMPGKSKGIGDDLMRDINRHAAVGPRAGGQHGAALLAMKRGHDACSAW
jgi:hypothetical protein